MSLTYLTKPVNSPRQPVSLTCWLCSSPTFARFNFRWNASASGSRRYADGLWLADCLCLLRFLSPVLPAQYLSASELWKDSQFLLSSSLSADHVGKKPQKDTANCLKCSFQTSLPYCLSHSVPQGLFCSVVHNPSTVCPTVCSIATSGPCSTACPTACPSAWHTACSRACSTKYLLVFRNNDLVKMVRLYIYYDFYLPVNFRNKFFDHFVYIWKITTKISIEFWRRIQC